MRFDIVFPSIATVSVMIPGETGQGRYASFGHPTSSGAVSGGYAAFNGRIPISGGYISFDHDMPSSGGYASFNGRLPSSGGYAAYNRLPSSGGYASFNGRLPSSGGYASFDHGFPSSGRYGFYDSYETLGFPSTSGGSAYYTMTTSQRSKRRTLGYDRKALRYRFD